MTGGEIVAAGKAVQAVGSKILTEDQKTKDALLRAAEDTPEMKAAARTMAARVAVKEQIKLKLHRPLARLLGISSEYFEDTFAQDMAEKMADVPAENIVTPPPNVAIPAIQGLVYTFEEPNLKDLYLNLLATASDDRRSDQAHPAFAEIIKQLSPREAKLLNDVLRVGRAPVARVIFKVFNSGKFVILMTHLFPNIDEETGQPKEEPQLPVWVDNWRRLGLIEVTYAESSSGPGDYDWVKERPEYIRVTENFDPPSELTAYTDPDGFVLRYHTAFTSDNGVLRATDFGRQFFRAVNQ